MLPAPTFHHLHLNSVDPDAAIGFYTRQFPSTARTTWGGLPALKSPTDVLLLFSKVDRPPPTAPQSAIWHFGWHVVDARRTIETFKARPDVEFLPLYATDEGETVLTSSDTWPGTGGVHGLTKAQIAEARAKDVQPTRKGGFSYVKGPDNAIVEFLGDLPVERMNHVHLYQEDPFCAQLWYQQHLNAPPRSGAPPLARTEADCKVPRDPNRTWPALEREGMFRVPTAAVEFSDVALTWYANQNDEPLVSSRGQLYDHIALGVRDLDAWLAKLVGEGVTILERPYPLGDTRAFMIEGPSREALELVETQ